MSSCFTFPAIVVVIISISIAFRMIAHRGRVKRLRAFARQFLEDWTLNESWFKRIVDLKGTFRSRSMMLSIYFEDQDEDEGSDLYGVYKLAMANPVVNSFHISRDGLGSKFLRWLGLHSDEGAVGDKFRLKKGDKSKIEGIFQVNEFTYCLNELSKLKVEEIRLEHGFLVIKRKHDLGSELSAERLERIFNTLDKIARLCERQEVRVKVLGDQTAYSWTGGERARCPYCREDIKPEDATDPLMACSDCNTLHHTECYEEAGGCTIFGCGRFAIPDREQVKS